VSLFFHILGLGGGALHAGYFQLVQPLMDLIGNRSLLLVIGLSGKADLLTSYQKETKEA